MAPKVDKGTRKAEEKAKSKVIEDKTFGLKNKNKSKAVQKYIKGVAQQVRGPQKGGDSAQLSAQTAAREEGKKKAQQSALLNALFKGTENIKKVAVDENMTPQTIKEDQKISLYTDQRNADNMQDWDLEKLEQVIKTKHGAHQPSNQTDIICMHFLEAVEKRQYGWFWVCPGGGDSCKYRHCLPPGYVLKRDVPAEEADDEDEIPIEELIEQERAALPSGGTPVTLESFNAWKIRKEDERLKKVEEARAAEAKKTGGKGTNILSGRDLFIYDPTVFVDDDDAADADDYEEREESDDGEDDDGEGGDGEGGDGEGGEASSESDQDEDGDQAASSSGAAASSSAQPSSSSKGKPGEGAMAVNAELFLDGDIPDDLDDLDD